MRPVAFACIGTDRSTGDALGPLVGQKLLRLGLDEDVVVGTLERPLHALNMAERLRPLLDQRPTPLIVAVDAALGALTNVGAIQLRSGGLRPGEGVGKDIPEVGELAITATVNVRAGSLDVQVLQSTRLWLACWWALRNARRAGAPSLAEVVAA
jgi:putative sporulation protein YyaC